MSSNAAVISNAAQQSPLRARISVPLRLEQCRASQLNMLPLRLSSGITNWRCSLVEVLQAVICANAHCISSSLVQGDVLNACLSFLQSPDEHLYGLMSLEWRERIQHKLEVALHTLNSRKHIELLLLPSVIKICVTKHEFVNGLREVSSHTFTVLLVQLAIKPPSSTTQTLHTHIELMRVICFDAINRYLGNARYKVVFAVLSTSLHHKLHTTIDSHTTPKHENPHQQIFCTPVNLLSPPSSLEHIASSHHHTVLHDEKWLVVKYRIALANMVESEDNALRACLSSPSSSSYMASETWLRELIRRDMQCNDVEISALRVWDNDLSAFILMNNAVTLRSEENDVNTYCIAVRVVCHRTTT